MIVEGMSATVDRHSTNDLIIAKAMKDGRSARISDGDYVRYGRIAKRDWSPQSAHVRYEIEPSA